VSRDVTLYIDDMIEACQRVMQYSAGLDRDGLSEGTMITDAIVRNLEILGEAAKSVPADVRTLESDVPWRRIAGLRDVLSHAYFSIDLDIVWNVIAVELPSLLPQLRRLRTTLGSSESAKT
jgi:uncharacterized protein with HEPN domain